MAAVTIHDQPVIALDNGAGSIKIGYAGSTFPHAVIPTVVGRPLIRSSALKQAATVAGRPTAAASPSPQTDLKELMIGDETTALRHLLDISSPIANGVIRNEADMALLWNYAFSEKLRQDPSTCWISTSEPPGMGDPQRARLFEMLFEQYRVPAIQTNLQGTLIL